MLEKKPMLGVAFIFTSLLSLLAVGCVPVVDTPRYQQPRALDVDEFLKNKKVCSKKESEQEFTDEAKANVHNIEQEIETKNLEYIDCDGKVTARDYGPVDNLRKLIPVAAPVGMSATLNFVEIENARTCSVSRVDAGEGEGKEYNGDSFLESIFTRAWRSGAIKLWVTDSEYKFFEQTNLADGANVVHIRYFGKCIEYRHDRNEKMGESFNCLKAEVLASRAMTIHLKIKRPRVDGVHRIDRCYKKPS